MKSREFVRDISPASIAVSPGAFRSFGKNTNNTTPISLPEIFSSNGFDDEQEEYPNHHHYKFI